MRQSIEKKREMMSAQRVVTVMFHDRRCVLGAFDSFVARDCAAPSLSGALTGVSAAQSLSSLSRPLSVPTALDLHLHRTRRRKTPSISKLFPEQPLAASGSAVLSADLNKCGVLAGFTETLKDTEQRRCFAA